MGLIPYCERNHPINHPNWGPLQQGDALNVKHTRCKLSLSQVTCPLFPPPETDGFDWSPFWLSKGVCPESVLLEGRG